MVSAQIRNYEISLEQNWDDFQEKLQDDFSLMALTNICGEQGFSVSYTEWGEYFQQLTISKSKVRLVRANNDNQIEELSEAEVDYVVGGVAAVPVLGAAVVVAAVVALAAAVFVATVAFVSISVAAATSVWVTHSGRSFADGE